MAEQDPVARGRIFISYRREETAYPAGWLFDRLSDRFGDQQIFKDVDSIEPGDDFVQSISNAVGSCDVLLALIGDDWLTVVDANGRRRLDDPTDFVRLEIEAALSRDVRVIPLLVDGARMPRVEELPASLGGLVRRQALELSPSRFTTDLDRLLRVLERTITASPVVDAPGPAAVPPPAPSGKRPDRMRRLLSTPRRVAIAAAAVVLVLAVVIVLAIGGDTASDGGGDSSEEEPTSEEDSTGEEGSWPALVAFLAASGCVVRHRGPDVTLI